MATLGAERQHPAATAINPANRRTTSALLAASADVPETMR